VTTANPQPKSSKMSSNNPSDDNKKTSIEEASKEQPTDRKVAESSAGPSDKSKIGLQSPGMHKSPNIPEVHSHQNFLA
jgi:hypothetical protein